MTHKDYEARYGEAVASLKRAIMGIGEPKATTAGTRFLDVDGTLCDDAMVFRLVWGDEISQNIMAQGWTPRR
jgi:hypothetical protein